MDQQQHEWLAERFEAERSHLRAVAFRMLGSLSEADDAVQESWLHVSRADTSGVKNFGGWLTTVVARVCLDMLRARTARREQSLDAGAPASAALLANPIGREEAINPEDEVLLADAVGLALLVVLDTLKPAERLAFVLHDLFDMSFEDIAPVVRRSPGAARQLASRARRRVRGATTASESDLMRQRTVINAFLAASRAGDFAALLAVLDPDVVYRAGAARVAVGAPDEVRGATAVARRFAGRARDAQPALINGSVGFVWAPGGQLRVAFLVTITGERITAIEIVSDPTRLHQFAVAILND